MGSFYQYKFIYSQVTCFVFFAFFITQTAKSQPANKNKDTVYYLLDTASVPLNDRMFEIGEEAGNIYYILKCRCYPWNMNPIFFSVPAKKNDTHHISDEDFRRLKKISLVQLTDIAFNYGKDKIDKTDFYFIEPSEDKFKIMKTYLLKSRKPRGGTITMETIKPSN